MRANFEVDSETWYLFRKKCLDAKTSASEKLRTFVEGEVKN
jgi:hypothetical protein